MSYQYLRYRPDLQGLRAIAILLVVLGHSGLAIAPGGFIGVDVFFILSGYLITGLLLNELIQKDRISLLTFYSRRLKRLFPSLIVMLGTTFFLTILLLSGEEARVQLSSAQYAATWTSNIYFVFSKLDYFNELGTRDIFLHTWSLGVEEQFYLIWPLVLLLFFKAAGILQSSSDNKLWLILPGLIAVFIASLALSFYWVVTNPQFAFYLMPSRIWQLSLGGIASVSIWRYFSSNNKFHLKINNVIIWFIFFFGILLIIGSAITLSPKQQNLGFLIILPSFGAAIVISSSHFLSRDQINPLANPVLVWLGDHSYSLYLWHWPVFIIAFSLGFQVTYPVIISLVLISTLASILSYRLIELPFWKGKFSHFKPVHIVIVSLIVMTLAVLAIHLASSRLLQFEKTSDISNRWRTDVPIIYRMSCDTWYLDSKVVPCVLGKPDAQKTVVLLGDSIGAQWYSLIPEIFPDAYWRTIVLTKSSCPLVDVDYYYPRIGKIYQVCTDWRNAVLDMLDKLQPDILIMGSSATYNFDKDQWTEGSSRIFSRVSKAASKVIVIPGTPSLGFDGPGCISRNITPEGHIDPEACLARDRLKEITLGVNSLKLAAKRFSNVYMLDLNELVCPDGNCNAVNKNGLIIFRDNQHLTDSFVRSQSPSVRERLNDLENK